MNRVEKNKPISLQKIIILNNMLVREFEYYLENQQELVRQYNGKYIVIIGETVVGSYEKQDQALFETQKEYELGTFLIQKCSIGSEDYTQTFHSRVVFI